LAPLACGALLMLAASLPEALAATSRATGVKASPLELVSCASAGNCTAVGDGSSGHKPVLLLTETSGKWAAGVEARLPADVGKRQFFQLLSMSCASAGNCTAVGDYTAGASHEQGLLLTETSGRWATAVEAPLPANAATPLQTGDASEPDAYVSSVSCASAGNCTAVGGYDVGPSGFPQGMLLTETSGTWATAVQASLPANAGAYSEANINSVSCASAGNCTAVGDYANATSATSVGGGLLLTETSGRWAAGVEAPAHTGPELVSCASAGNCTAVGSYTDRSGHEHGLLLTEKSGKWAAGVEASLPANANKKPSLQFASMSCASPGNCTAVGSYTDRSGRSQGLLLTERSSRRATAVEASLPANAGTNPTVRVNSVSCVSAGHCTAVGDYSLGENNFHGLLLTEAWGKWATGVQPELPANAGTPPFVILDSVSCVPAGNCTAVGGYTDSSGHSRGLLLTVRSR
jgi:hypothetical protein